MNPGTDRVLEKRAALGFCVKVFTKATGRLAQPVTVATAATGQYCGEEHHQHESM